MPILRLLRIAFEACRFAFGWIIESLWPWRSRFQSPERLYRALARLGTTFIKFGQALSIRRDMLPDRYITALQSLREQIAPLPPRDAIREIEHGLGRPIKELFADFDRSPPAAASVAQVHAARLPAGREAIVKVRRSGIKFRIDQDMRALKLVARAATEIVPRIGHYQPLGLIEEMWTNLQKEIDFRHERRCSTATAGPIAAGTSAMPTPRSSATAAHSTLSCRWPAPQLTPLCGRTGNDRSAQDSLFIRRPFAL
jgi:ubiquinone biosynthesis protein